MDPRRRKDPLGQRTRHSIRRQHWSTPHPPRRPLLQRRRRPPWRLRQRFRCRPRCAPTHPNARSETPVPAAEWLSQNMRYETQKPSITSTSNWRREVGTERMIHRSECHSMCARNSRRTRAEVVLTGERHRSRRSNTSAGQCPCHPSSPTLARVQMRSASLPGSTVGNTGVIGQTRRRLCPALHRKIFRSGIFRSLVPTIRGSLRC